MINRIEKFYHVNMQDPYFAASGQATAIAAYFANGRMRAPTRPTRVHRRRKTSIKMRKKNIPDRLMDDLVTDLRRAYDSAFRIVNGKLAVLAVLVCSVRELLTQREQTIFKPTFKLANIGAFPFTTAK
jgi:hypothetical protein